LKDLIYNEEYERYRAHENDTCEEGTIKFFNKYPNLNEFDRDLKSKADVQII